MRSVEQVLLQPYAFTKDFSYLKYLEESSHFERLGDRLESSIDAASDRAAGAASASTDAQERTNELLFGINAQMTEGFARLEKSVDRVNETARDILYSVEDGFQRTIDRLDMISSTLEELLHVARTPEQTWAYEQFSIAQDLFRRRLFEEALMHVDHAIGGRDGNSGYRYDHRLHFLKGLIHLGSDRNTNAAIVDLSKAHASFQAAARYAEPADNAGSAEQSRLIREKAKCLALAGWASYCIGDFEASASEYDAAVATNRQEAKYPYYRAKVAFHVGDMSHALDNFARSINLDYRYAIRTDHDPDFLKHKDEVHTAISQRKAVLHKQVQDQLSKLAETCDSATLEVLKRHGDADTPRKVADIEERLALVRGLDVKAGLGDLTVAIAQLESIANELPPICKAALEKIDREISRVQENAQDADSKAGKLHIGSDASTFGFWTGAALAGLTFLFSIFATELGSGIVLIFSFVASALMAAIVGGIFGLLSIPVWSLIFLVINPVRASNQKNEIQSKLATSVRPLREDRAIIARSIADR